MNFETISDETALWEAVLTNPEDLLPRLALADWYEQTGDDLAANCWRWLEAFRFKPQHRKEFEIASDYNNNRIFPWWCFTGDELSRKYEWRQNKAKLPPAWIRQMTDDEGTGIHTQNASALQSEFTKKQ